MGRHFHPPCAALDSRVERPIEVSHQRISTGCRNTSKRCRRGFEFLFFDCFETSKTDCFASSSTSSSATAVRIRTIHKRRDTASGWRPTPTPPRTADKTLTVTIPVPKYLHKGNLSGPLRGSTDGRRSTDLGHLQWAEVRGGDLNNFRGEQ